MEDRITALPSNIIEAILMRLSIAEAGRTSILSSRWRYEWSTIPHLIFERDSFPFSVHPKLNEIVDQVLLLHNGPIRKFVYDGYQYRHHFASVDRWLVFLSRNGLMELNLKFSLGYVYEVPSSLFLCKELVSLQLRDIGIRLPRDYNGFDSLTTLYLKQVIMSDDEFADLISKCPLLKKLIFMDFDVCTRLKVNAPNLHELVVEGFFEDIYLENTPSLAILSVGLEDGEEEVFESEHYTFTKSLWHVLGIERLELRLNMLEFMGKPSIYGLPTYNYLKNLFLGGFNFEDLRQISILCCLLRGSPVLEELEIEADSYNDLTIFDTATSFSENNKCSGIKFEHLLDVKVLVLEGLQPEMEFIEFVLANAPVLRTLTVTFSIEIDDTEMIYQRILQFRKASTVAKIINLGLIHLARSGRSDFEE